MTVAHSYDSGEATLLKKKEDLDDLTIEDYFSQEFLDSNFWFFWRFMAK